MALRPLIRVDAHGTDGKDHHFYIDLAELSSGAESFLNGLGLIPDCSNGGLRYVHQHQKIYDFVLPGYYDENDLAAIKEALAKSIVAVGESPISPFRRIMRP
jgi:hypothetical protein